MTASATLLLDEPTIDAIAERVASKLKAAQSNIVISHGTPMGQVVDVQGAMQFTRHRSQSAFYRWCGRHRVRALEHGRYSLRRLMAALETGGRRR